MSMISFDQSMNTLNIPKETTARSTPFEAQKSFSSFLKESLNTVNEAQIKSDQLTEKMALGQDVELHQVMIASQKASVGMQLTLEIRNKAVEAYQEIMRMQV